MRTTAPLRGPGAQPAGHGRHTIWEGDCLALLAREVAAGSVDVVVTSPPYNIGVAYRSYDDRRPRAEYLAWLRAVGRELARVLKADGSLFLNVGGTSADPWLPMDIAGAFRDAFVLQNHVVWVKSVAIGEATAGHFKPINSRRFLNHNHESIFHFSKAGTTELDRLAIGVPFKHKSNIARWGHAADRRCAGDVWFIPYETVRSKAQKYDHPAGFPAALPARCIRLHGLEKTSLVLDPFLGAGTTLVAAARLASAASGSRSIPATPRSHPSVWRPKARTRPGRRRRAAGGRGLATRRGPPYCADASRGARSEKGDDP